MNQQGIAPEAGFEGLTRSQVRPAIEEYLGYYDRAGVKERKQDYPAVVNDFYHLVTKFYEFAWGQSFHFAPRRRDESFPASLARYERYFGERLGLAPGMRALDIGCGVGGPLREIVRASGAHVTGLNLNAYQVEKARRASQEAGLGAQSDFLVSDFMKIDAPDAHFDAAYQIEATCHAPDKVGAFREIARVLKPGALFAGGEWCVTDRYDASDPEQRRIVEGIERGNALPELVRFSEVREALQAAGFAVLETHDGADLADPETPWYVGLAGGGLSIQGLARSPLGRTLTGALVRLLEALRLAPRGTAEVSRFLNQGADALVAGGERGIFTPLYFFLARKRS